MSGRNRLAGFTLIEILITLSIVSILAAVAYPSYLTQIQKVRRADAQTVLMQNAQILERIYTQTGCYNPGLDLDCRDTGDNGNYTQLYTESPIDGTARYNLCYAVNAGTDSYTLQAVPVSSNCVDGTAAAGRLTLNNLGQKTWDEDKDGAIVASEEDWQRN